MTGLIDISVPLHSGIPVWPGSTGYLLTQTSCLDNGDASMNSMLDMDVHVGTHVDAPCHFIPGAASSEALPLEALIGPACVALLEDAEVVTPELLSGLDLAPNVERLLLKTRNSELWEKGESEFRSDFVALTADAARWLVDRGIVLIGIDYLSVQRFGDPPLTHEILLRSGMVVLEGLNLAGAAPGRYELICLPLRLVGSNGAPARAVLRPLASRAS
ncbi:MAG: cyclase family protein [Deltaproteobacteria bacterium]|nr:cyclase family protein [Deltaproteobacteria bacterium]